MKEAVYSRGKFLEGRDKNNLPLTHILKQVIQSSETGGGDAQGCSPIQNRATCQL